MSWAPSGLPLSTYLFILTTMFQYVELEHQDRFGLIPGVLPSAGLWDLQFADDTALLANSASLANRLLHAIQRHGHSLGLSLNTAKCEHLQPSIVRNATTFVRETLSTTSRLCYIPWSADRLQNIPTNLSDQSPLFSSCTSPVRHSMF